MKRPIFEHATGLTALVLFALFAAFSPLSAKPGGNGGGGGGNPGGGGDEDPPTNPAPVEYQLTWLPGTYGYTEIHDINSAGIAVGRYHDETGTPRLFWTTSDGIINPLDDWWTLPAGWRMGRLSQMQINEANQVSCVIVKEATSEVELFIADLLDPNSLEPLGPVPNNAQWLHMNEYGDVALMGGVEGITSWVSFLYVRSLDTIYNFGQDFPGLMPTGINDNLQISLVSAFQDFDTNGNAYDGSARLTFDPATEEVFVEDLGSATVVANQPLALAWGGINNAGTIFGCFETSASSRGKRRNGDATAGFIVSGATSWTELDPSLPIGSSLSLEQVKAAACAQSANEFGQVVGGYDSVGHRSEDLWLLDPVDGLFNLNDMVVGDTADVDAFRSANAFRGLHITEPDPATGYGIISGYDVFADAAFILTPALVTP